MVVDMVMTKWGPWDRHGLKLLKDAYAEARRDSLREFQLQGQPVVTDFAKYLIQYLEGEGLTPCECH
jgi:hypothetical protein